MHPKLRNEQSVNGQTSSPPPQRRRPSTYQHVFLLSCACRVPDIRGILSTRFLRSLFNSYAWSGPHFIHSSSPYFTHLQQIPMKRHSGDFRYASNALGAASPQARHV